MWWGLKYGDTPPLAGNKFNLKMQSTMRYLSAMWGEALQEELWKHALTLSLILQHWFKSIIRKDADYLKATALMHQHSFDASAVAWISG